MAEGWSSTAGTHALATELALYTWVKLHIAAPGAAATTSPAVETDRVQADWTTPAAGAATTETTALSWTSVAGTEDYTHFSVWSAITAGAFGFSGTITANPVTVGDTFTIGIGDLDVSVPLAS